MKNSFYIFFSWQADIPDNTEFIDKKIKQAINSISKMPEMSGYTIEYDHSTQNRSGSPSIIDTVHEKINKCDVFIADITPIVTFKDKQIPNPNVMAESGFALRAVGEDRIILLMRKDIGVIEKLPFDIKHRRINCFKVSNNSYKLEKFILSAIQSAQSHGENIYEQNVVSHDSQIFDGFQKLLIDESILLDTIDTILNNQQISLWEYEYFENLSNYSKKICNQYLINVLKTECDKFIQSIEHLLSFTMKHFSPMRSSWKCLDSNVTPEEKEEASKESYYSWIDKKSGEFLDQKLYDKKLNTIITGLGTYVPAIRQNYAEFRKAVMHNLFI